LWDMAQAWCCSWRGQVTPHSRLAWFVILGTVPVGIVGLLANGLVSTYLRSTLVIAITTIIFGLLLYLAERKGAQQRQLAQLSLADVLLIGVAQAFALIPGTSRSGVTMTAAMLLGFNRTAAARFSFLLSIPVITLAGLLKVLELDGAAEFDWRNIALGAGIAFISAYLCIHWFLQIIERIGFIPFVVYRLILGIILFLFFV